MNPQTPPPFDIIAWLIALLTALFGASSACVRRVAAMRGRTRGGFARMARRWLSRGRALAYAGEDDATVEKRIARMEWIARDPVRAMRHLARRADGLLRARLGGVFAPPAFAPPALACAPLVAAVAGPVRDDTS
ncbi:MAG: hypothetical protein NW200_14085 [Hyphomonadaceae bacterium]|nr:hypothetical protein [Hyphomonadaceae bacterium]